jgi:hypothetical protein
MARKITQMALLAPKGSNTSYGLIVLADDGSLWFAAGDYHPDTGCQQYAVWEPVEIAFPPEA